LSNTPREQIHAALREGFRIVSVER